MPTRWFRFGTSAAAVQSVNALPQAEHALMAEALLRSTASLLERHDPTAVVEQICQQLVDATAHVPLAWVWFGDPRSTTIKPQVVVGSARAAAGELVISREFLTQSTAPTSFAKAEPMRSFEISPLSLYAPWRQAALSVGARSVLVVPIANAGDERGLLAIYAARAGYFDALGSGLFATLGPLFHAVLTRTRTRHDDAVDATRDRLTGLHNRSHAQRLIDAAWSAELSRDSNHKRDHRGVLLVANVDEFKRINDACGRRVGDMALRHVAQTLTKTLRHTDLVARWRGDEFLAWLPGLAASAALSTAEQLRVRVAETPLDALEGLDVPLRISIGATPVPATHSFATAFDRADRALNQAKSNGRNCVVVARSEV